MTSAPASTSSVIMLRPALESDADALFPLIHRSPVTDTILWDGPDTLEQYRTGLGNLRLATERGEKNYYTIVEASTGAPIGGIDFHPQPEPGLGVIGLWIGAPYHSKGYGTEALRQLLEIGRQSLSLKRFEAYVFVGNVASRRIFEKNGFRLAETIPGKIVKRGVPRDEWRLVLG